MLCDMSENHEKSISKPPNGPSVSEDNERDQPSSEALSLPSFVAGSGTLDRLVDTARDYARAAASASQWLPAEAAAKLAWSSATGTAPLSGTKLKLSLEMARASNTDAVWGRWSP